jgi:hypothetical protein
VPKNSKSPYRVSFTKARQRVHAYKLRRPHRSFQVTRRRDYTRSLELPGFIAFTREVNKTFWRFRKVLLTLAAFYAVLTIVLVGIGSQETYETLTSTLQDTGSEIFQGNLAKLGEAGVLFISLASTGLAGSPTEAQQIYTTFLGLLVWLTTVWLIRNLLAGHKPRVRDGLYNAGAPIISTFVVLIILFLQLLPIGLAIVGYTAASATGLLAGGVEAMLFWMGAGLLGVLSLYLVSSTFLAMIVVTLPGMYPIQALRSAGDMAVGRRIRILLRILWMLVMSLLAWAVVLIPIILLDTWLKSVFTALAGIPVIPIVLLIVSVLTVIWIGTYVYLLYRKVVDDEATPA